MGSGGKEKEPRQKKKPGRVPTSCAECRRLKLRCDRGVGVFKSTDSAQYLGAVPCEKCVARGCGSICPDGVLAAGKGNRLVLANTEELHERIDQITARNRELENALRKLQEAVSDQPHPLLESGLRITMPQGSSSSPSTSSSSKSPISTSRISPATHPPGSDAGEVKVDDGHNVADAFGTLVVGRRGESYFLGKTARPEYLAQALNKPTRPRSQTLPRLSASITAISCPEPEMRDSAVLSEVLALLPSHAEALNLCDLYLEYGKFLYSPMPRDLLDETLSVVYRAKKYTAFEHHHSLSLLFVVFAIASLFNPNKQPYSSDAYEYYHLSRTALLVSYPKQETTPTFIQTLIHMAHFLDLSDMDPGGLEPAWTQLGNAVRLSQSIGLHLNSARWKLPEELAQRRHDLFWKLFVSDTWTSFYLGRPSSLTIAHIDCPVPQNLSHLTPGPETDSTTIFHSWTIHYTFLLHTVMQAVIGAKQPGYSVILDYDRKIRNFHVPVQWQMEPGEESLSVPNDVAMYRWLVLSAKEIALLHLHQIYFAQALQEAPGDIHRHRYIPSVAAIYRSACRLIHGLAMTWRAIPKFLSRVNLAWSHGLSAAIVACLFVTRAPSSHLSSTAMEELSSITALFESSSSSCQSTATLLTLIQNLRRRAHEVIGHPYTRFHHSEESSSTSSINIPEIERLNGKTHLFLFNDHVPSSTFGAISSASSSSVHYEPRSPATSVTISDIAEGHPPFLRDGVGAYNVNLHPTLSQDVQDFSNRSAPSHLTLFDYPSDAASSMTDVPMSLSPPPALQPRRETPPVQGSLLQPYQPHRSDPPPPQPPSQPMQYFNEIIQHEPSNFFEPRRSPGAYMSPFGGSFPTGFQSGFFPGGFSAGFCPSPIVLDSSWNSFVEQLGF